ncbi:MAG TPA: cytochrome c maturation protein CcmE, partial [Acidimicrobiales bacterium]|nr:cytochrome c maturation protein CcmE [Acidimicrobiales bacterium]
RGRPMTDIADTTDVAGSPAVTPPAAPPDAGGPGGAAPGRRRPRSKLRLLVVFAVLVGAVVFLLVEGLGSSLDYFDTVDQALAHKTAVGTTTIRLEGTVVPGTIRRTGTGADFVMSGGPGKTVVVHNVGSPPELFQTNIPVVVDGHFASAASTLFLSDQIEVKHSATYVAAHPTRVKGKNGKTLP